MVIFTIIVLSMAVLSAIFWLIEIQPFIRECKTIPGNTGIDKFLYFFRFCGKLNWALPFIIDMIATVGLSVLFGLGGVTGTAMGLTISNVISVGILWNVYGNKGQKAGAYASAH
jgi:hypothetical protein